jgi:hypothetical protein
VGGNAPKFQGADHWLRPPGLPRSDAQCSPYALPDRAVRSRSSRHPRVGRRLTRKASFADHLLIGADHMPMSSGSSCVESARSQNITVRWRRSALGSSRSAAGAGGTSARPTAGNGCGSAVGSDQAARPSGAQTRSSPSRSVAMCNVRISSRRRSSRASLSRPKTHFIRREEMLPSVTRRQSTSFRICSKSTLPPSFAVTFVAPSCRAPAQPLSCLKLSHRQQCESRARGHIEMD